MMNPPSLPHEFFDSHHHFLDTTNNRFQTFLGSLVPNEVYLPTDYQSDVVAPLAAVGVTVVGSTHVECIPDDGVTEANWIESLPCSTVQVIVASADLTSSLSCLNDQFTKLCQVPKVRGIRWILDCVGTFDNGNTATHVATTRHDGKDYLRGSNDGYDGDVLPDFERGFALLEDYGLSFDLQCAPVQLPAAARLFARYPNIPVVIDHLGKPRMLLGPDTTTDVITPLNEKELQDWRIGMKAMAALPHVFVKISMLGYCVPGWIRNQTRMDLIKVLVREIVALFGPQRCMIATNFWKNPAMSDSDGLSDIGPNAVQFLTLLNDFLSDYSETDRLAIFCGTAKSFYKVDPQ